MNELMLSGEREIFSVGGVGNGIPEIKQLPFQECLLQARTFQTEIPDRVMLTQCSPHCSHTALFAILLLSESFLPFLCPCLWASLPGFAGPDSEEGPSAPPCKVKKGEAFGLRIFWLP